MNDGLKEIEAEMRVLRAEGETVTKEYDKLMASPDSPENTLKLNAIVYRYDSINKEIENILYRLVEMRKQQSTDIWPLGDMPFRVRVTTGLSVLAILIGIICWHKAAWDYYPLRYVEVAGWLLMCWIGISEEKQRLNKVDWLSAVLRILVSTVLWPVVLVMWIYERRRK
jgi:hypothetical protein